MKRQVKKHIFENQVLLSVFLLQEETHFTRKQRLGCFFVLIFMNMIGNAIWYRDEVDMNDAAVRVKIGQHTYINMASIMASVYAVITTYPICILIIVLFKKAKPKQNKEDNGKDQCGNEFSKPVCDKCLWDKSQRRSRRGILEYASNIEKYDTNTKTKTAFSLPSWSVYITWALVMMIIVSSAFFTLLYSMEWVGEKSAGWLLAFMLTITGENVLIDPLKVIIRRFSYLLSLPGQI